MSSVDSQSYYEIIFSFSARQWATLTWTIRISALLSILGSATIIFMILRRRKTRLALLHNRLILSMSIIDILNSLSLGSGPSASPREMSNDVFFAYGNKATCTAQGFFISLGISVAEYNALLCIYYLAVIRYNAREETLQAYERYMHIFAIFPSLFGGIWGVVYDLFRSNGGPVCWVVPRRLSDIFYDYNFSKAAVYNYGLLALTSIILVTIVISMIGVYHAVWKQARTMEQYHSFRRNGTLNTGNLTRDRGRANNDANGAKKETAIQAFLYFGAYICTYTCPILQKLLKKRLSFSFTLLITIFTPLQGAFNSLAFIRPKFIALEKKNKERSTLWLLKAAIFSSLEEEEQKKRQTPRSRSTPISNERKNRMSTIFWDGIRCFSLSTAQIGEKTYTFSLNRGNKSQSSLSQHSLSVSSSNLKGTESLAVQIKNEDKEIASDNKAISPIDEENQECDGTPNNVNIPQANSAVEEVCLCEDDEELQSSDSISRETPPRNYANDLSQPDPVSILSLSSLVAQDKPVSQSQRRSSLFLTHSNTLEDVDSFRRQSLPPIRLDPIFDEGFEDINRNKDDTFY